MTRLLPSRIVSLVATLSLVGASSLGLVGGAIAAVFGQKEIDASKLQVMASPFGNGSFQLLIVEQLSDKRPCWSESGSNPILVDPLLVQFNFTGICGRSTDSNGYSVRMANRDFGLVYDLNVVRRENELVLIATNITDRKAPVMEVGRTNGLPPAGQFAKIVLDPGWRLTKRTQSGKELGHVYLTNDGIPPGVTLSAFVDTQAHWARNYIDVLAAKGIVSGFSEDNSFRPDDPVTRVQFAAIVNKAFASVPSTRAGTSFKDVKSDFWGAQAIQTAYQKGFMSGYPDNTFKPNQAIPRLEVLVSLASGLQFGGGDAGVLAYYQDGADVPTWAGGAIAATTDKQIVVNYPRVKQLNPNRVATRAEVAAFVYQALVNAGQLPIIPSPYVVVVNPQAPGAPGIVPDANAPQAPVAPAVPNVNPPETPVAPPGITPNPNPSLSPTEPGIPAPTAPVPVSPQPSPVPVSPPPAPASTPPVAPVPDSSTPPTTPPTPTQPGGTIPSTTTP